MNSIERRLTAIEKKLTPLYLIRQDIRPIKNIMAEMNYHNLYNPDEKDIVINEGCKVIKSIIIDLAHRYMKDKDFMAWKESQKEVYE